MEKHGDDLGNKLILFKTKIKNAKSLALLSNNQFEEAYEAYNKAIQLEPNNEGYKQNLKIVEEKLKNSNPTGLPVRIKFGLN